MSYIRRLPVGTEVVAGGGVDFRIWAPACKRVRVAVFREGRRNQLITLQAEQDGYFRGTAAEAVAGDRYGFLLDGEEQLYPDPASRFQPEGPHELSQVIDPAAYAWSDAHWRGVSLKGQVLYELHIGTFTPEGTWRAAALLLPSLVNLGITVLEVMPVADFPGDFGWGYDGVNLFAPTRLYGSPDDFRFFVDEAHSLGLAVILDVVYNHFGPDGNYLGRYAPAFFSSRYKNEWGEALNFDDEGSGPVREFFIANAGYWIDEYHLDGLRLDATQQIFDESPESILAAVGRRVREAANGRQTIIISENERQNARLVRPLDQGGYGLDGLWNDDFHHSAVVAATGRREAYYADYAGSPQELVSAARRGFLLQGQRSAWQKNPRGTPSLDLEPYQFITFIENHDQVANTVDGRRLHELTSSAQYRAITGYWLLAPGTPLFFQGQEFASSAPFHYFAHHGRELARAVRRGRGDFLAQFRSIAARGEEWLPPDPAAESTFLASKLDPQERARNIAAWSLHEDLLRLRRQDPVVRGQGDSGVDGAVISSEAFVIRLFGDEGDDRLIVVNLGMDLELPVIPEPLVAPPADCRWSLLWSSEDRKYGGAGTPAPVDELGWHLTGHSTVLLQPSPMPGVRNEHIQGGELD